MPFRFNPLHFKRNTQGSSNELSFDVLDAARESLDKKEKGAQRSTPFSQGSYKGVGETVALSGQSEVKKRKTARRRRRLIAGVALALACLVTVGVIGFNVVRYAPSAFQATEDFKGEYQAIVEKLSAADSHLTKIDDAINLLSASSSNSVDSSLQDQLSLCKNVVSVARQDIQKMQTVTLAENRKQALRELDAGAEARYAMLESAENAFASASAIDQNASKARSIWSSVVDADKRARSATQEANAARTEQDTVAAKEHTQQALDQFSLALADLRVLSSQMSNVDFSSQIRYLELRIEALQHAIATSEALLSIDRELAKQENDLYNSLDSQAAELAESLPASLEDVVRTSSAASLTQQVDYYRSWREKAISSDAIVRSYLNSED